ncbi:hypothetical protein SK128_003153 [Halocaridina rubra]|uniref:PLAC domain-containing protein n=1 Tax=Halocaridina rubra TaxID=373956 RepID=A0AAN8WV14_HALRR
MILIFTVSLFVTLASSQAPPFESQIAQHQETANLDPSMTHVIAHAVRSIEITLQNHQQEFDKKFSDLEKTCKESNDNQIDLEHLPEELDIKLGKFLEKFVDELLRFSDNATRIVEGKMEEALDGALEQIDLKLESVNEKINDLSTNMHELVTHEEVTDIQNRFTYLVTNSFENVTAEVLTVRKMEDEYLTRHQMEQYFQNISTHFDTFGDCGSSEAVEKILNNLQESDKYLENISEYLQDLMLSSSCSSSCNAIQEQLQSLQSTLEVNKNTFNSVSTSLDIMKNSVSGRIDELEMIARSITATLLRNQAEDQTRVQAYSTVQPPTKTTTMAPIPCMDTRDLKFLNICNLAVRLRKCFLDFVAFHCCRSCLNAGLITGPPNFEKTGMLSHDNVLKILG